MVGFPNAGKSTLLKAIVGELVPLEGRVEYSSNVTPTIAYLAQRRDFDFSFPISVREVVSAGLWREVGAFARIGPAQRARVDHALEQVGLIEFASTPFGNLSGGQVQRALFARVLVQDASIVLLDEPFTALDVSSRKTLTDCLRNLNDAGTTVIAVLHNMQLVREIFPRTLLLARELIAHDNTDKVFTPENLLRAQHMQESFDELAAVCRIHPEHLH